MGLNYGYGTQLARPDAFERGVTCFDTADGWRRSMVPWMGERRLAT